jgi:hypothetical protein
MRKERNEVIGIVETITTAVQLERLVNNDSAHSAS